MVVIVRRECVVAEDSTPDSGTVTATELGAVPDTETLGTCALEPTRLEADSSDPGALEAPELGRVVSEPCVPEALLDTPEPGTPEPEALEP